MAMTAMKKYRFVKIVFRTVALWCVLYSSILSAVPEASAESAAQTLTEADRETYTLLASGKKIQQERDFVLPKQPTVYLTFDDGPSALTPQVLDILKEAGVHATFFEVGQAAEAHPDIVKRVVQEGHALGNHSYDHIYKSLYGDFSDFWQEINKADDVFDRIVGIRPRLLRAPGGSTNFDAFYYYYLDQAGFSVFDWNIDSGDSRRAGVPADEIINTVKAGPFPHEATLLMHDGTGHTETVRALPEIIRIFKGKGYSFAVLSEQVKPVQFRLGKPKSERSMSESRFGAMLGQIREAAANQQPSTAQTTAEPSPLRIGGAAAAGRADEATPADRAVPLQLRLGAQSQTMPAVSYELTQGKLHVPLRLLAGQLGADIGWLGQEHTAVVRFGFREIRYDIQDMAIRCYAFGRLEKEIHLPDMKLKDGSIYVSLRAATALLGFEIGEYSMDPEARYVALHAKGGQNVRQESLIALLTQNHFSS